MKALKIAILTGYDPYTYRGGIEQYSLKLKEVLSRKGIETEILFPTSLSSPYDLYKFFIEKKTYIEKNYDLILYNSPYGLFVNLLNIPKIAIIHGSFRKMALNTKGLIRQEDFLRWFHMDGLIEYLNINLADRVIAVSNYLKNIIIELYGQHLYTNITVVNNCIDTDIFKPIKSRQSLRRKYNLPLNAFIGLFVGRNDATKGYDIFREVFFHTKKKVLWIQAISSGGLNQYNLLPIKTFKEVDTQTMVDLYNLCDFVFLPSRFEGFGLAYIESLACATPAITSNVGIALDFKNLWEELKFDTLLPMDALIRRIKDIISFIKRKHIATYIGKQGRILIKKKYSSKIWGDIVFNEIKALLNQTSSSANV